MTTDVLQFQDASVLPATKVLCEDGQAIPAAFEQQEFVVPVVDDETKVNNKIFLMDLRITSAEPQPAKDDTLSRIGVFIRDNDVGTLVLCQTADPCYDRDTKTEKETVMRELPEVTEGGPAAMYSVMLSTDPATAPVVVTITPQPEYEVTTSEDSWLSPRSATITFTTDNFATPQRVWIRAVDDNVRRGDTYTSAVQHQSSSANADFDDDGSMRYVPEAVENSMCSTAKTSCITGSVFDNDGGIRMSVRCAAAAKGVFALSHPLPSRRR